MSGDSQYPQTWLARTASFKLIGPIDYERLVGMIQSGDIRPDDEVCPANSYWFSLKEDSEVARWLGIQVPKPVRAPKSRAKSSGSFEDEDTATSEIVLPERPNTSGLDANDFGGEAPESTRVLSRASHSQAQSKPSHAAGASVPVLSVSAPHAAPYSGVGAEHRGGAAPVPSRGSEAEEESSFFKSFGWLLIAGAALVFYIVLRMGRLN